MQKEELKQYLNAAIDALSQEELDRFTLSIDEPDLFSVGEEVVALKGEVKKMNSVSLKLSNEIHALFEKTKEEAEKKSQLDEKTKDILLKITEQDELIQRTRKYFDELPKLKSFFKRDFQNKFYAWREGFYIQNEKWQQFIDSIGLTRTGNAGEIFDKEYHEAVDIVQKKKRKDNEIVDVEEVGYLYKDILLKRAKVIVNKLKTEKNG